jgi:NAD(P)-dependent dehydrogenase (short-subunit alcohol dehydrogenase family)
MRGLQDFSNLRAIVTGGGSGIGLATARMLAAGGAQVCCLDLDLGGCAAPLVGIACDVSDDATVKSAVAQAAAQMGGIDIVVNNAGVGALGSLAETSDEDWRRVMDINLMGMVRVTRAAHPFLTASQAASVVNMGSAVALMGLPNRVLYATTKGAILSFTRALAADFMADAIRVNCVSPGVVNTPWQQKAIAAATDPAAHRARLEGFQPSRRMVEADEVAAAVCFLAHPLSGASNGVDLPVDGGLQTLYNLPD